MYPRLTLLLCSVMPPMTYHTLLSRVEHTPFTCYVTIFLSAMRVQINQEVFHIQAGTIILLMPAEPQFITYK